MNVINKLLLSIDENCELNFDEWTREKIFLSGKRKWVANIVPVDLLNRSVKNAIQSLMTLNQEEIFYKNFPDNIKSPDYGDNWGVTANYIEINK